MLALIEKVLVGFWLFFGLIMAVNALVLRRWQFGVAALGFVAVAAGWELLRRHWRTNSAVPTADAVTIVGCLILVCLLVAIGLALSTLRG